MGAAGSRLEKAFGGQVPEGERYFGLENFGNTCYCNSVLQVLYFCVPFREQVLEYYSRSKSNGVSEDNLLVCLAELFAQIQSQKKKTGVIAPKRFVRKMKMDNETFNSPMHQDAHEFLIYVLSELVNILENKEKEASQGGGSVPRMPEQTAVGVDSSTTPKKSSEVWVHTIFQGTLANETRCLRCETVTAVDEPFLDLSLNIEQNSSISSCLRNFSSTATLNASDKFKCEKCMSFQEAERMCKIKGPPRVLTLHLKRFLFMGQLGSQKKLLYRVVFPLELKLCNTTDYECPEYSLFAVVVHIGGNTTHGHYVSLVKSHNHWLYIDDENVEVIDESYVQMFFGSTREYSKNKDNGYLLFYEKVDAAKRPAPEED